MTRAFARTATAHPSKETQQEVDDYNELLDGPKDGQSYDDWAAALDAAHDVLFGDDAPTELETASSESSSNGDGDCNVPPEVPGNDLCQTELSSWVQPGSSMNTAAALCNPTNRNAIEDNLEACFFHLLKIDTAGSAAVVSRPKITRLACDPTSELSISVPVAWDAPIVGTINAGTISLHASVRHQDIKFKEWCIVVSDYQLIGVDPFILPLVKARIKIMMELNPFCGGEFSPTPMR